MKTILVPILVYFCLLFVQDASAIDSVRVETRVDDAVALYGVSGQNVAVAIMDRGVDWKSMDFRNDDGTTRIAFIFDLTDDTGANWSNNSYGMGTIYSREQIDSALNDLRPLSFRDAVGHGTATTGILCGNGNNSPDKKYRGIAPNATIICIKITTEGAPAHGNEPPESPFYDPARIPVAIDFAVDKANELGMPCVMLLNLGSIGGPTDGTSELCRKIDETVGAGKPGLVFITGAGDDGGNPNHASYTITSGQTDTLKFHKASSYSLDFDLWYSGDDRFDVNIETPSATYGPYSSPATNDDYTYESNSEFIFYHNGSNLAFGNPADGKREIWMRVNGNAGDYKLILTGSQVVNGKYDATINPSTIWNQDNNGNVFQNHVVQGNIWDGATAYNNITPTCYVLRTSWEDIDGITRSISGQGNPGELWHGSSTGPTFDGRYGVDISAPGQSVVTTYSPTSYWATFRNNLIFNGNGLYGMGGAVSAASPIIAGIVALMFEMKPDLDAEQVKQILQESAKSDDFTRTVPNNNWGYGKVDALTALNMVHDLTDVNESKNIVNKFSLSQNYPNPFNPSTKIKFNIPRASLVTLEVYDVLGKEVATLVNEIKPIGSYEVSFDASHLSSGIYFYKLQAGNFIETKKMILLK